MLFRFLVAFCFAGINAKAPVGPSTSSRTSAPCLCTCLASGTKTPAGLIASTTGLTGLVCMQLGGFTSFFTAFLQEDPRTF